MILLGFYFYYLIYRYATVQYLPMQMILDLQQMDLH